MGRNKKNESPGILVVDDEPNCRTLMAQILEEEGYRVFAADDVETAYDIINKRSIGVLVTDVRLPGKSGIELLKMVKQSHPHISVILITAYASIDSAVKALKDGAFYYFEKPVNFDVLKETIRESIGNPHADCLYKGG